MIRGLDNFKNHFRQYSDNFILVGGVAAYLLLDEAGASRVRLTKDIDIVLIMNPAENFLKALKKYIELGGYEIQKGKKGQSTYYRFQKPRDEEYPIMLELFSAVETGFELFNGQRIIPVPDAARAISLSAILLDEEYFSLIRKNAIEKGGIFIINEKALIPFKAKAYLEIKERGEDSKNWKKHRADIINLAVNFLTEESKEKLSEKVHDHFVEFMRQFKQELTEDVISGACDQEIPKEVVISLLAKTFL